MAESIVAQIKRLQRMSVGELRQKYVELFGEETRSRNRDWLWKRLAYRVQELAEGSLSERARWRAEELADEGYLRARLPKRVHQATPAPSRDPRLPEAGAVIVREHNGDRHEVTVLDDGFLYGNETYRSLSAVARAITGTRWNGFAFFNLTANEEARP